MILRNGPTTKYRIDIESPIFTLRSSASHLLMTISDPERFLWVIGKSVAEINE